LRRGETVRDERGDDAACEQRRHDGERSEVADLDDVGGEDLDPDEGEDECDRLVDVAEAADEDLDESEQGAEPEQRERVRGPDHERVARSPRRPPGSSRRRRRCRRR
jgi:hypothetical protein